MSRKSTQRKHGTTRGHLGGKAQRQDPVISRNAVGSRCVWKWGGWGQQLMMSRDRLHRFVARASAEASGVHANRSAEARRAFPGELRESNGGSGEQEGPRQTERRADSRLDGTDLAEMLALKSARGRRAFRN